MVSACTGRAVLKAKTPTTMRPTITVFFANSLEKIICNKFGKDNFDNTLKIKKGISS